MLWLKYGLWSQKELTSYGLWSQKELTSYFSYINVYLKIMEYWHCLHHLIHSLLPTSALHWNYFLDVSQRLQNCQIKCLFSFFLLFSHSEVLSWGPSSPYSIFPSLGFLQQFLSVSFLLIVISLLLLCFWLWFHHFSFSEGFVPPALLFLADDP